MNNSKKKLPFPTSIIDTHAHLNDPVYSERIEHILSSMKNNGVEEVWDVSTTLESINRSIAFSKKYPQIKSWVGIDPEIFIPGSDLFISDEANNEWFNNTEEILREIITENKENIVGLGETGMDYHWLNQNKELTKEQINQSKHLQARLFRLHLALAEEYSAPLTIHSRGAEEECLKILNDYNVEGIFHSYTGSLETARKILDSGFGLGINGIITFKNATELRDMYKTLIKEYCDEYKLEGLHDAGFYFETDSPFLAPEGKRGEKNEPANVSDIYAYFQKEILQI